MRAAVFSPLQDLPAAYGEAFEAFAAPWSPRRRAAGRAVLLWLINTPPMNTVRPRRSGDELEWRLISYEEWFRLRSDLADVLTTITNDELIRTVLGLKDFHPTAHRLLPAHVLRHMGGAA